MYQQGDTLYYPVDSIPKGLLKLDTDIVQSGEATNHHHRLHGDGFQLFENPKTKEKHLRLVKPTSLKHEEHHEIKLPPGDYRIGIVREYDHFKEEARQVAD